jgi:hypothetical protein
VLLAGALNGSFCTPDDVCGLGNGKTPGSFIRCTNLFRMVEPRKGSTCRVRTIAVTDGHTLNPRNASQSVASEKVGCAQLCLSPAQVRQPNFCSRIAIYGFGSVTPCSHLLAHLPFPIGRKHVQFCVRIIRVSICNCLVNLKPPTWCGWQFIIAVL